MRTKKWIGVRVAVVASLLAVPSVLWAQGPGAASGPAPSVTAGGEVRAPAAWLQQDPGRKAYSAARNALNERKYAEAARMFEALRTQYPKSGYVADSYYYQSFALSRQATSSALRRAVELLKVQQKEYPNAATSQDAAQLRVRIEGQLARQGDASSAAAITEQASQPCTGDQDVRLAALGALLNMNASRAVPILRKVLEDRDSCSVELRRRAVFLLAQKMSDSSVDILLDLAERHPDPDPEVRKQAVFWLSQVHSPAALGALQSILKDSHDPDLQEEALFALSQQESDSAVEVLRQYAERASAPEDLREKAIFWIGQSKKAGGARYLMDLYGRLNSPDLKEKALFGIAQNGGAEGHRWLLARAMDPKETMDLRKNALFWAGQSGTVDQSELRKLYGSFQDPELKGQVIFVASQEGGKDAADFLMDVAKTEKNKDLREKAIFWLGQSKDPRVADFLLGLIRK